MSNPVEFEVRGPLSSEQIETLRQRYADAMTTTEFVREIVVFFVTDHIKGIGDFDTGKARLSLKIAGGDLVVRLKLGNPSSSRRVESTMIVRPNDLEALMQILTALGIHSGFYRPTKRLDIERGDFLLSLKTASAMGNHFELEYIGLSTDELYVKDQLAEFVSTNDLTMWNDNEYRILMAHNRKEYPALEIGQLLDIMKSEHPQLFPRAGSKDTFYE